METETENVCNLLKVMVSEAGRNSNSPPTPEPGFLAFVFEEY